jgi:hypothetical protein
MVDVTGTWRGVGASGLNGLSVPITLNVTQSGATVSGTYSCNSFSCISTTGSIRATVNGRSVTGAVAFPSGGGCSSFNGTVSESGRDFAGTYVCQSGFVTDQGTFTLTR